MLGVLPPQAYTCKHTLSQAYTHTSIQTYLHKYASTTHARTLSEKGDNHKHDPKLTLEYILKLNFIIFILILLSILVPHYSSSHPPTLSFSLPSLHPPSFLFPYQSITYYFLLFSSSPAILFYHPHTFYAILLINFIPSLLK